ncbi:hypothetical protein JZ751_005829, partial [Albula glossodonta]
MQELFVIKVSGYAADKWSGSVLPQAQAAWKDLNTNDQLRAATMLLDTVEEGAFVLADNLLKTDIVQENTENIQLEVARLSTDGNLAELKFPQTGGHGNSIQLSGNTLKQHGRNGEIRMAFVLYKHLGAYLSTENASIKLGSEVMSTNYSVIVNSPVITAAINKESNKVYLTDPVIFTLKHLQPSEENLNPNCSFWSYSKRTMTGYWSTQDCRLLGTNRTHTTCSCTHLTNFAVLMAHIEVKRSLCEIPKTRSLAGVTVSEQSQEPLFIALLFGFGSKRTCGLVVESVFRPKKRQGESQPGLRVIAHFSTRTLDITYARVMSYEDGRGGIEQPTTDPIHDMLLDVITYVGILLSLVCLLICVFTFCFFRGLQSDRNTIHKNLCISLFIAESLFLLGINRADQPIACAVFAALLHFFFLAAFTWMFLEGVQLYIMLVEVFESEHSRKKYFYLVGYGIPALIVAVCWLRLDTYFIWSFIGPATLIIMLNVVFLGIALYKMFHHTAILKPDSGCLDNIKSWVIGAIALLCLLGLTWAFGLMYVNENTVIMAYLFTIFNSLQGMFIFIFHCVLQKKVRKEYGRCLRAVCCSGKSVETSIGSGKSSASRAPGRYSTGSQSRIRRMWNDTVRKQSESSFITGDINSSASLNRGAMANHLITNALLRPHGTNNPYNTLLGDSAVYNNPSVSMYNTQEGILNNARDTSVMDTLPLNGNHGNSYSIASGEYMSDCVQIIDRGYNHHKETTLEKKILKELTSNYIPSYLNNHERSAEQSRNLINKLANSVNNGSKDDGIVLDDVASFGHEETLGLELIREESNAPLLPQRPPSGENHQPLHFSRRRIPQENSESFFPLLTNEHTEDTQSPHRDSLYTSMPALSGSPVNSAEVVNEAEPPPSKNADPDDVYYKSMPNLGSRNHIHQLHTYYQLGRGSSDGFIVPPNKED